MCECKKYRWCQPSRNDRIRTQTNSLRKIINTFAQQFKNERIPYVTNIVLAPYVFLGVLISFFMLDDIELNHKKIMNNTYWCKMNKIAYILHHLNNSERYLIIYWLVRKMYLFGDIHQWMSSYQNIKVHLNI